MFGKYPTFWVIQKRFAAVKYFYVWNYPTIGDVFTLLT